MMPTEAIRSLHKLWVEACAAYEAAESPEDRQVWAAISTAIHAAWAASCKAISSDPALGG